MSRELLRRHQSSEVSFQDRLRQSLQTKLGGGVTYSPDSALLLDTSGSMADYIGANQTKWDELKKLAQQFTDIRRFAFSSNCTELGPAEIIPYAAGGTSMGLAFDTVKIKGIKHLVMITDGCPDNPQGALQSAQGLKIDVFYVGPDPAPDFLKELARVTGGAYGKATLQARAALEAQVRKMLPAPSEGKKAIAL